MLRKIWIFVACALGGLLQAHADPLLDFSLVLPPPPERQALTRPTVIWEVRSDAASHCASVPGHDGHAVWREGCVYWNRALPSCTIVTTGKTTHSLMGRLLLLCLQGGETS